MADKGGKVVVLDKTMYRDMALKILDNTNMYRKLTSDPTDVFKENVSPIFFLTY